MIHTRSHIRWEVQLPRSFHLIPRTRHFVHHHETTEMVRTAQAMIPPRNVSMPNLVHNHPTTPVELGQQSQWVNGRWQSIHVHESLNNESSQMKRQANWRPPFTGKRQKSNLVRYRPISSTATETTLTRELRYVPWDDWYMNMQMEMSPWGLYALCTLYTIHYALTTRQRSTFDAFALDD